MKLKWWHAAAVIGLLYVMGSGGEMSSRADRAAQRRQESQHTSDRVRAAQDRERDLRRLSGVALSRYRNNCVLVVDSVTRSEIIHKSTTTFVDKASQQPLPPGLEICNSRGWTAVLNESSEPIEVARATRHDSDENGVPDTEDVRRILND